MMNKKPIFGLKLGGGYKCQVKFWVEEEKLLKVEAIVKYSKFI